MGKFRKYLDEETTAGDIASVDSRVGDVVRRPKHLEKGKKCIKHKRLNCKECDVNNESKWN